MCNGNIRKKLIFINRRKYNSKSTQFNKQIQKCIFLFSQQLFIQNNIYQATSHCEINCINQILQNNNNDSSIFQKITLFVTCEPCIMCAHALAIIGIKETYFGCYNDRFGGNGTVLELNTGNNGAQSYKSFGGYLEPECKNLFKELYEKGNENLEEEKRHRKKANK
ncbi:tRNA-specific adenosine deaminase, putative [Ichthyophthirius multifiliis]|uniref:tRNA-specific adenosine deaminase, putative n=1 Tax=Ichthyophthirius multifiliis TaxID=5932 RepID=G0QVX8_ICHMU|nr:tRNA-specific adenosine deaminase, putative [Ichthyophthirius multifiliis]EGR30624.1 tRNA-specific adenosine deaminase, putative [Ichthyophthirius multifiliis]|eukprot:XP_004032211.1 tRNA-specific adenosine deaminase, putative [Ichthyophthirius multifiliis]